MQAGIMVVGRGRRRGGKCVLYIIFNIISKAFYRKPTLFLIVFSCCLTNCGILSVKDGSGKTSKTSNELIYFPYRKIDKWGFCDSNKNVLIKPIYDEVGVFAYKNIAVVKSRGKYGCINKAGDSVTSFIYSSCESFFEEKTIASVDENYGVINSHGGIVIPFIYNEIRWSGKRNNLFCVKKDNKWIVLDYNGNLISKLNYDEIQLFRDGFVGVKYESRWGVINSNGDFVIKPHYEMIRPFHMGMAVISEGKNWGFINGAGTIKIQPQFSEVQSFQLEGAWVRKGKKWGLIDSNYNLIIDYKYDQIRYFKEGKAFVEKEGKCGYVNRKGDEVISFIYDYAEDFSEGLAEVCIGKECGYIDTASKIVIAFQYEKNYGGEFHKGLAEVKQNELYGFIDKNGKVVVPIKFNTVADYNHFDSITGELIVPAEKGSKRSSFDRYGFYFNKSGTLFYDE